MIYLISLLLLTFAVNNAIGTPVQNRLIGGNKCTWGPSYWCQHLDSAKECQAVSHCVNVWKRKTPSFAVSGKCTFCKSMITDLKMILGSGKTKAEIAVLAEGACTLVSNPTFAGICSMAVKEYLPEIMTMLEQHLDDSQICSALGLCAGYATRSQLTSVPKLLLAKPATKPVAKRVAKPMKSVLAASDNCLECKAMITEIKSVVEDKATAAKVEDILKQRLCASLGELKAMCESYVVAYVPEILQLIGQKLDAGSICKMIGFCNQRKNNLAQVDGVRHAFLKLALGRQMLAFRSSVGTSSSAECEVCELVVTEARSMIQQNKTQVEIEDFLRDRLCKHLGPYQAQCQAYVTEYAPMIFELLASELDPTVVCQALGACGSASRRAPVQPAVAAPGKVAASSQCVLCEYVLNYLEQQLQNNRTVAAIEQALLKVCAALPATVQPECNTFVLLYGPTVLKLLVSEVSPARVCTALSLCTGAVAAQPIVAAQPVAAAGVPCQICEFVLQTVDRQLATNATQAEIEGALLKACDLMPATIAVQCNSFVTLYGPSVIKMLVAKMVPAQVCTALGVCSQAQAKLAVVPLQFQPGPVLRRRQALAAPRRLQGNGELCQVCQVALQYTAALLKEKSTVQEIEAALNNVCNFLPAADKQACNAVVTAYTPQIVQLIVAELNPKQICALIKLCPSSTAPHRADGLVHLIRQRPRGNGH